MQTKKDVHLLIPLCTRAHTHTRIHTHRVTHKAFIAHFTLACHVLMLTLNVLPHPSETRLRLL